MSQILFLDDDHNRHSEWRDRFPGCTHVQSAGGCFERLHEGPWDLVCLDHDLGRAVDGTKLAQWMALTGTMVDVGEIIIHSHNPDGARRMAALLIDAGYSVSVYPFGPVMFDLARDRLTSLRLDSRGSREPGSAQGAGTVSASKSSKSGGGGRHE